MGPEPRAVFAQTPAFFFKPTVRRRRFQRAFGQAGLAIFGRVEPGEMLADDLVAAEALDPLGAGVPTRDEP